MKDKNGTQKIEFSFDENAVTAGKHLHFKIKRKHYVSGWIAPGNYKDNTNHVLSPVNVPETPFRVPPFVKPGLAAAGILGFVLLFGRTVPARLGGLRARRLLLGCPYFFMDEGLRGGLGDVYTVRKWRFGRTDYVLKRLRDIRAKEHVFAYAFMAEYMILGELAREHYRWAPRLVDASAAIRGRRDFSNLATDSWYVMTKVDGLTLDCVIADMASRSREYTFTLRLRIVRELALAIKTLHEIGIAHRDITPDNIFVTGLRSKKTRVVLIDFGSGYLPELGDPLQDKLILKNAYAPPEQFRNLGCAGSDADIYAFGIICYEVLSGKRVFPVGKTYTAADHENFDRVKAARELMKKSGVHARIANYVCLRLMAAKVRERGSIHEFFDLVEKHCVSRGDKG